MARKHTLHVALPEPLTNFVEQRVAEGRYRSAGAPVQAALSLFMEHQTSTDGDAPRQGPVQRQQSAQR